MRVAGEPPDVAEPGEHVLQLFAPPVLYLLSEPHGVSVLLPLQEW